MKASVAVAQTPVSWDVARNVAQIEAVLAAARPDEIVVLPEGALSGYGPDLAPLDRLDPAVVTRAARHLATLARGRAVHVFCGSLIFDRGAWWNAALYLPPRGNVRCYRKVNLAQAERGRLAAGSALPPVPLRLAGGPVTVGVQICRELRFPEQWRHLADTGAFAFVFLTHAANPDETPGVWRSHLISRAAENQRFVLAANVADAHQHCPSMVVAPRGDVVAELPPGEAAVLRTTIAVDEATDWYLGQRRRDLLQLRYRGTAGEQPDHGPADVTA